MCTYVFFLIHKIRDKTLCVKRKMECPDEKVQARRQANLIRSIPAAAGHSHISA